jgi:DNA-binding response OmpR family regulator
MKRILVIEDNANLAYGIRNNLEIEGYEVDVAADGESVLTSARASSPDLIVLDLMLPDMDGFRVLRALRQSGERAPILILTARSIESDKVRGLKLGADDYVTKPFGIPEFLARVEALLRRASRSAEHTAPKAIERFGVVRVDSRRRSVVRSGRTVALTPKEFDLLAALLRRRGAVVTRRELLREVWGYPSAISTRTLDTHVAELRRKLEEDPGSPRHILTVWKTGYRLER